VNSGLFRNISGYIQPAGDRASLVVCGDELPSLQISPDVTVTAGEGRPNFFGGVRVDLFVCNNSLIEMPVRFDSGSHTQEKFPRSRPNVIGVFSPQSRTGSIDPI
jgi:hypothetical protein